MHETYDGEILSARNRLGPPRLGIIGGGQLAKMTALKYLDLHGTKVSNLSPLANLTALQWLFICGTKVSDLSPLNKLTGLRQLHVSKAMITEAHVQELKKELPNCQIERY